MSKKNEVAVKENTAVAVSPPPQAPQGILASDVIVPRLLLMQSTSEFVKDRKATMGDIVRSTNQEKLGDPDTFLDFIPLAEPAPTWIKEKRIAGTQRWEFAGIEPRTASNDTLPWKFNADKDGKLLNENEKSTHEWRRLKCLSLYAILPADVEAFNAEMVKANEGAMPDLSKALTPVMIGFRSTGFPAGKEVSTFFTQAQSFKKQAWEYTIKLSCFLDKNDQGTFYVFKVDRSKPAPVKSEYLEQVKFWASIVRTTVLRVDDAEEGDIQPGEVSNNF